MKDKLKVVVIEDDEDWMNDLCELLNEQFDAELEKFYSFEVAEKRLLNTKMDFDLLVTDVFSSWASKRTTGFYFAKLVSGQGIPVIVVTGVDGFAEDAFRQIDVLDAFHKDRFSGAAFILAIRDWLNKRKNGDGNEPPKPPDHPSQGKYPDGFI